MVAYCLSLLFVGKGVSPSVVSLWMRSVGAQPYELDGAVRAKSWGALRLLSSGERGPCAAGVYLLSCVCSLVC